MAVKYFCDSCGKDCGAHAVWVTTEVLSNPVHSHKGDYMYTDPRGTIENCGSKQYMLCMECYDKTMLPNPYSAKNNIGEKFRPLTKYEEIMLMGTDEFAEWLFNYSTNPCNMCDVSKGDTSEVAHTNCIEKIKQWLNSEVSKCK